MDMKKTSYKRISWMIHLLVWIIIYASPFLFIQQYTQVWRNFYWRFFVGQSLLVIVFYANYCFLINRYLFRKQLFNYILLNLLLISVLAIGWFVIENTFFPMQHPGRPDVKFGPMLRIMRDMTIYTLTAALSVAIKMTGRWYESEAKRKELESIHTEAELKNLKNQLNPHFLFNTLNNIYSLIGLSQDKAQEAVHQLSKLLRYVLYDNNQQEVALAYEVDFIKNYLELVKLRLSSKVSVSFDVIGETARYEIAPLLFISLIENAFKHGVTTSGTSFVHIQLDLTTPGIMKFTTENSFFPKNNSDKSGSGIGLENLRRRLALIYPDRYHFISEQRQGIYYSELTIRFDAEQIKTDTHGIAITHQS